MNFIGFHVLKIVFILGYHAGYMNYKIAIRRKNYIPPYVLARQYKKEQKEKQRQKDKLDDL
jgi:hypothetical protein